MHSCRTAPTRHQTRVSFDLAFAWCRCTSLWCVHRMTTCVSAPIARWQLRTTLNNRIPTIKPTTNTRTVIPGLVESPDAVTLLPSPPDQLLLDMLRTKSVTAHKSLVEIHRTHATQRQLEDEEYEEQQPTPMLPLPGDTRSSAQAAPMRADHVAGAASFPASPNANSASSQSHPTIVPPVIHAHASITVPNSGAISVFDEEFSSVGEEVGPPPSVIVDAGENGSATAVKAETGNLAMIPRLRPRDKLRAESVLRTPMAHHSPSKLRMKQGEEESPSKLASMIEPQNVHRIDLSLGERPLSRLLRRLGAAPKVSIAVADDGDRFVDFPTLLQAVKFISNRDVTAVVRKWNESVTGYRNEQPPPPNSDEFEYRYFRLSGSSRPCKFLNESALVSFLTEMSHWCRLEKKRKVLHALANDTDGVREIIFGTELPVEDGSTETDEEIEVRNGERKASPRLSRSSKAKTQSSSSLVISDVEEVGSQRYVSTHRKVAQKSVPTKRKLSLRRSDRFGKRMMSSSRQPIAREGSEGGDLTQLSPQPPPAAAAAAAGVSQLYPVPSQALVNERFLPPTPASSHADSSIPLPMSSLGLQHSTSPGQSTLSTPALVPTPMMSFPMFSSQPIPVAAGGAAGNDFKLNEHSTDQDILAYEIRLSADAQLLWTRMSAFQQFLRKRIEQGGQITKLVPQ